MENTHRLFGLFAILLVLVAVTYFGCNNSDDDDSNDDDVDDDSSAEPEVGTYYYYHDGYDPECSKGEHIFQIINPSYCLEDGDPNRPRPTDLPSLQISIVYRDEYPLEQQHERAEDVMIDGTPCSQGFYAIYLPTEDFLEDKVIADSGYVIVQRLNETEFEVEFDLEYEGGSKQDGVWVGELCGENVPE